MNAVKEQFQPNIAIHPGVTIEETLHALGMKQIELADRTGLTKKTINELVNGKSSLTPQTAIRLERVLGISASFWNNLEKNYQETVARLNAEKEMQKEYEHSKAYTDCYKELSKWQAVKTTTNMRERTYQLLKFFGVNSLTLIDKTTHVVFRQAQGKDMSKECLAGWLRFGELEAKNIAVDNFNKNKILNNLQELRNLTNMEPSIISEKLFDICSSAGIALVFAPYFKKTYVNGATRWINDKAVIQLSIRNRFDDIFWFTFFHELAHILKHSKKEQFIDFDNEFKDDSLKEKEADEFAANTLIPKKEYDNFISNNDFSSNSIKRFAGYLEVSPSIVAGRLAHDKHVEWHKINHLRRKLTLTLSSN